MPPPLSFLLTILYAQASLAAIFPFHVHIGHPTPSVARRAPTTVAIGNTQNAQYVSNMTIGGVSLPVLLDTGSSDLWMYFPKDQPANTQDSGKSVTLRYAVGKATGHVKTTAVSMGNMTVPDQAFLHVTDTSTFSTNIAAQSYSGLLGLGPNVGSIIRKEVSKKGPYDTFLQRLFVQDKTQKAFITFLLDRKGDPTDPFQGQFSIEEVIPGFENITSMPKLDVDKVNRLLRSDQHWQALTDEDNGIIGPDGNPIRLKSIVPGAPKGQFVAVIDNGFTFSQVPREVSDAIYGRVQGAVYDVKNEYWTVPCGQYLNISFNFGGRNYPVHPLDVVDDNFGVSDPVTGKRVCIGAFQPITTAFSILGNYDMILGMSFLRNVYTLLDFGDWIKESNSQDNPYIQLASLTNIANARRDFVQVRLGGNDTISDSRWQLVPADQGQKSPISEEEKKKKYQEMILSRWPYIFLGCLAFLALSIGFCVWKCCQRRKRARQQGSLANNSRLGFMSRRNREKNGGNNDDFGPPPSKANFERDSYTPSRRDNASTYSYTGGNTANNSSAHLLSNYPSNGAVSGYPNSPSTAYRNDYSNQPSPYTPAGGGYGGYHAQ